MLDINVKKKDLLAVLSNAQGLLEKKPTMDILQNVFIYTDKNKFFIEATDLEISYKGFIDCQINNEGAILVNGKILYGLIKTLNFEEIKIKEENNFKIKILSPDEKNDYKLSGLDHENFPKFKTVDTSNSIEIESDLFLPMMDMVSGVTSSDPLKIALSGILFTKETIQNDEGEKREIIRLVSSDGHRLNLIEKDINNTNIPDFDVIIPKKGFSEMKKLIEKVDKFRFGIFEKYCFITSENFFLLIRLIDDKYPNYKKSIPTEFSDKIVVDRLALIDTLSRISILSTAGSFQGFKLITNDGFIRINSLENEVGEISEDLPAELNKKGFIVAFNENYFLSILNILKSEKINIFCNDSQSPCMIKGDEDPGFLGLVMPMNIQEDDVDFSETEEYEE